MFLQMSAKAASNFFLTGCLSDGQKANIRSAEINQDAYVVVHAWHQPAGDGSTMRQVATS